MLNRLIMIVYKIKDSKIIAIHREESNYELLPNEYSSNTWWLKPHFNGSAVVESITQQEIDDRAEQELEQQNALEVEAQLSNGRKLAIDIFVFVRKHTGLTVNQKSILKSLAVLLYQGDIEQALIDFNAISRPATAGKMQNVYDYLAVKFGEL